MRKIIHGYGLLFAAVEMRDNPALRDIPIAMAAAANDGVISTANYPARKFGVRSAMPTGMALKLCRISPCFGRFDAYKSLKSYPRNFLALYLAH